MSAIGSNSSPATLRMLGMLLRVKPYLLITAASASDVEILENSAGCNRKLPI